MIRSMEYNSVEIDWISQWVLSYLTDADSWESTSSISAALTLHDGVTDSKVRRRLRKLRNAGLVTCRQEPRENVADADLYKPNSDALSNLHGLSQSPSQSVGSSERRKELEEMRVENNRLESEIREVRSELELLQNHFNNRGTERIGHIEERQEYLMEHADTTETHLKAAAILFDERGVNYNQFLERAAKRTQETNTEQRTS